MVTTVARVYDLLFGMRRCRIKLPNRCYHLISRVAHRAYFLDEDERTRLVDFVRRVAEFSGVKLLAYSVMSNHFHVFVYIGRPESLSDAARHLRLGLRRRGIYRRSSRRATTSAQSGLCSFFSGSRSRRHICARRLVSRAGSTSRRRISVR